VLVAAPSAVLRCGEGSAPGKPCEDDEHNDVLEEGRDEAQLPCADVKRDEDFDLVVLTLLDDLALVVAVLELDSG